jgi:hypothetical protein
VPTLVSTELPEPSLDHVVVLSDWSDSHLLVPVPEDDSWLSATTRIVPDEASPPPSLPPIRQRRYVHAPRGQDGITPVPVYRTSIRQ